MEAGTNASKERVCVHAAHGLRVRSMVFLQRFQSEEREWWMGHEQNETDAFRKIRLRVEDVQGRNCLTNFWVGFLSALPLPDPSI